MLFNHSTGDSGSAFGSSRAFVFFIVQQDRSPQDAALAASQGQSVRDEPRHGDAVLIGHQVAEVAGMTRAGARNAMGCLCVRIEVITSARAIRFAAIAPLMNVKTVSPRRQANGLNRNLQAIGSRTERSQAMNRVVSKRANDGLGQLDAANDRGMVFVSGGVNRRRRQNQCDEGVSHRVPTWSRRRA